MKILDIAGLQHLWDKIKHLHDKKDYIVGYLDSNQGISKGDNFVFAMGQADVLGDCFELDATNKQIKVLKDCTAILSGNLFVDGSLGDAYIWGKINVNNKVITSELSRIINRDFTTCSIPTKAVSLKANDVINMTVDYGSDSGNPVIRSSKDTTFLSIVRI